MMKPLRITAAIAIFFGAFGVLEAHEGHSHGHSHGDEETAHAVLAESVQELYPRAESRLGAHQALVIYATDSIGKKLVDIESGESSSEESRLVLFLDDYATASPTVGARLDVSVDFVPYSPIERSPGMYVLEEVTLGPGDHEIELTLTTDSYTDQGVMMLTIPGLVEHAEGEGVSTVLEVIPTWVLLVGMLVFLSVGLKASHGLSWNASSAGRDTGVKNSAV